jgi:seryl-tRNA synthetase
MLDLKFIRENIDLVRQGVENRQDTAPLDEILDLDSEYRQKVLELESLRHQRKQIRKLLRKGVTCVP